MKLIAKQDFSWAHRGVEIEEFKKGQEIDTEDQDLIKVSTDEGWAAKPRKGGSQAPAAGDGGTPAGGDGETPPGPAGATPVEGDTDPT
ncbi:hypothetical protein [Acidovorax sp.]|uniref:hypothetical protein n=1 Tax=Acidovorax sp. TaxID=1872122 RepID=UPI0031DD6A41